MVRRKLTLEVEREILKAAAKFPSAQSICDEVNRVLGTDISRRAVAKLLQTTRTERADVTKHVVREELGKVVLDDLDVLGELRAQAAEVNQFTYEEWKREKERVLADREDENEPLDGSSLAKVFGLAGELRRSQEALKEIAVKRLQFAGADTPDDPTAERAAAAERLQSRLDRLAPSPGAEGPS